MNYTHVGITNKEVTYFMREDLKMGKFGGFTLKLTAWNLENFRNAMNGRFSRFMSKKDFKFKKNLIMMVEKNKNKKKVTKWIKDLNEKV